MLVSLGLVHSGAAQEIPAGERPPTTGTDLPALTVRPGWFGAAHAPRALELPQATRALGDTFDSELLIADTPSLGVTAWLSASPGGQSLPSDGQFQPAGQSELTGFPLEAGVNEFDNGDGTRTLVFSTRIAPFSDGFLPLGFVFTPSGEPIETLAWFFGESADRDGSPDGYDPQLSGPFPPLGRFEVLAADVFLLDNGVVIGSGTFIGLPLLDQSTVGFLVLVSEAAGSGIDEMRVQYLVQSAAAPTEIVLTAEDACLGPGDSQLVVEVNARGLEARAVGGQFFLEYNTGLLDFVGIEPGDAPFTREIFAAVDEVSGTIDYAVGVQNGEVGTFLPTTMARITFEVLGEFCQTTGLVAFRPGASPPSRLTDALGNDLGAVPVDLEAVSRDITPPSIAVPPDVQANADAGGCDAVIPGLGFATGADACSTVDIAFERSDASILGLLDPFPSGTTTIAWTATDACGNSTSGIQFVTVDPVNALVAEIELEAADPGTFDRCVTLELTPAGGGPPVVIEETVALSGRFGTAVIEVPCGAYECITARDTLHTLRRTDADDFAIAGPIYVADFSNAPGGDALLGGNLNADGFIDILDFGVFIAQFGGNPGADTPCGTSGPHADISGNGQVDTADFTFIAVNFLAADEPACGAPPLPPGPTPLAGHGTAAPVRRIDIAELAARGLAELAGADLNDDGVLDAADIAAFAAGARPDHLADLDGDGAVSLRDLHLAIDRVASEQAEGDIDRNGEIGLADLLFVAERIGDWRPADRVPGGSRGEGEIRPNQPGPGAREPVSDTLFGEGR
jgi:hypothetical protein